MQLWLALVLVLGIAEPGVAQTAPPSTMRDSARKFLATLDPSSEVEGDAAVQFRGAVPLCAIACAQKQPILFGTPA